MIIKCQACDKGDLMEWFQTECCGYICLNCFDGDSFYSDYQGTRAYNRNHPHEDCTKCGVGINADTGKTQCRDCRKKARTS